MPEAAARFAEALLCPNAPEGCGTCPACDRARRGLHPDLSKVALDSEAREVKVEAVRALCSALQLRPSEASRKVALILDADRLSPSAQNALLKTLEEPPRHTVLILACEGEERLLPTLRSRCLRIGFGPLPEALIAAQLQSTGDADAATASLVARLARGSLTRAESFGKGFRERRDRLLDQATTLLQARGTPAAALAALDLAEDNAADRQRSAEAIDVLAAFLRDVLVCQAGGTAADLLAPDREVSARALAADSSPAQVTRGLEALQEAATALDGNGAPRLQLEAAALCLSGAAP